MIDKHQVATKLLWVDLEMTGKKPARHAIIELVAEVTDFNFHPLGSYEAVVAQPESVLAKADAWSKTHHTASGLFDKVRTIGKPSETVEQELIQLIQNNFGAEPAILAGNSIHQDRAFIRTWWPNVERLLHYRMLDVSAWKVVMQGKYGVQYHKKELHRALEDIHESIEELSFYLDWLQHHSLVK